MAQARVLGGFDQQAQVRAPIAGDHGVRTRGLDFGNVGREISHLGERMQVFTDDLNVGAFACQIGLRKFGDLHAMGVVLTNDVDLLDVLLVFHVGGHGLHLHGRVRVQAEVPKAAFAVGQVWVDRGVIDEHHFFARVACIVLFDGIHQRRGHPRAIALNDITDTLVNGLSQGSGGFLRAELVVQTDDLKLNARRVFLIELFGHELVRLQTVGAHRRHQARQRINPTDLDRFTLLGPGRRTGTRQNQ